MSASGKLLVTNMGRDTQAKIAQQEEDRKNTYTGMVRQQMSKIPDDYTPEQKSAITTAELGGIDVGFGNLRDELTRRASATGSEAGIPETLLEGNRDAIQQKADAGAKLQEMFANVPVQRALQKASIFQPALSGMLFDRYPSGNNGTLNSIIGAGGGVASAALMASAMA